VTRNGQATAAIELGLVPKGQDTSTASDPGPPQILTGTDVNPLETEGLFTALLRLQEGLEANDLGTIQRAMDMLDAHVLQMNFARAELGARQQGLDVLQQRLDTEEVELREALSLEYDADLAEVISNLAARQAAFEAGLMATAQISQMTLLDYL
jgi:flagellar hook-associated protein 3 FlgL